LGRSRNDTIEARVKDAAIAAVAEEGFEALNVHALCVRAEVPEAEFLARWPDGWAAMVDAFDERIRLAIPDTGNLEDDLVAHVQAYLLSCADRTFVAFLFRLMNEVGSNERLRDWVGPGFSARRAQNLVLVERAVARGELPAGVNGDALLDAALSLRLAWLGAGAAPTEAEVRRAIRELIASSRNGAAVARQAPPKTGAASAAGAHRLYLFAPSSGPGPDRIIRIESLEGLSDSEAIAVANERRLDRYAELWRENHLLRIFERD
jgi:hypothetical protein